MLTFAFCGADGRQCRAGPRLQRQGHLVSLDKMEETDLAVGQALGFIKDLGQQLIKRMVIGILADFEARLQYPLGLFAFGDVKKTHQTCPDHSLIIRDG